jgi:hypothetical protein
VLRVYTSAGGTNTVGYFDDIVFRRKFGIEQMTNERIVFTSGPFTKITGVNFGVSSNLIEWYGLTADIGSPPGNGCTIANAITYLDNSGGVKVNTANLATGVIPSSIDGLKTGAGTFYSGYATSYPVGGTPGYTYAWSKVSGDAEVGIDGAPRTAANCRAVVSSASYGYWSAIFRCTVTDSVAGTATFDVDVTMGREY